VDENVFAYSNRHHDPSTLPLVAGQVERGLVIYHNRYADTRGWIKVSAAALDKGSGQLVQKTLGEALGLPREGFAIFRDATSHLEFIRPCAELWDNGMYAELGAYQCHVFMDWWFVNGEQWNAVYQSLNGAGVDSVQARFEEMFAAKVEVVEEVKVKKPRRKAAVGKAVVKKEVVKKTATKAKSTKVKSEKPAAKEKKSTTGKKAANSKTTKPAVKKTASKK
jgi:hypothetical protein